MVTIENITEKRIKEKNLEGKKIKLIEKYFGDFGHFPPKMISGLVILLDENNKILISDRGGTFYFYKKEIKIDTIEKFCKEYENLTGKKDLQIKLDYS